MYIFIEENNNLVSQTSFPTKAYTFTSERGILSSYHVKDNHYCLWNHVY